MNTVMVKLEPVRYDLPNPPSRLKHKRKNILEWIMSKLVSSHICQICGRKEIWSISGWLQINHPIYADKDGCSVVCLDCAHANPEVFGAWKSRG